MKIEYTPKLKGIITEERCKLYFIEHGWQISVPIGDNARYDFILDIGDKLLKLQCKTSSDKGNGSFQFESSMNVSSRTKLKTKRYTDQDIDGFCTWYDDKVYIVPFVDRSSIVLRTEFPKHNTSKNYRWAREYEADYVIGRMLNDTDYPERDLTSEFKSSLNNKHDKLNVNYHWITNGCTNKRIKKGTEIPEGFWLGRCGRTNQFT